MSTSAQLFLGSWEPPRCCSRPTRGARGKGRGMGLVVPLLLHSKRSSYGTGVPASAPPPPLRLSPAPTAASDAGAGTSSCCSSTASICAFLGDPLPPPAAAVALRRASVSLSAEPLLRPLDEWVRRRRRFFPPGVERGLFGATGSGGVAGQQTCWGSEKGILRVRVEEDAV